MKDKLEIIKIMFQKKKALQTNDLFTVLETRSRMTVYRYMKKLNYLTSYTHKGKYYTLNEIAQFDNNGLWHYGDIGFSKYGTLYDTIKHFVDSSEEGMTSSELQNQSRTVVKYALLDLIEKNKVSRSNQGKVYVYLSSDQIKAKEQLKRRQERLADSVDDETALRVLLVVYRLIDGSVSPEQVANILKKEGSKISLEIVQRVFRYYDLGKKTLDSISYKSQEN